MTWWLWLIVALLAVAYCIPGFVIGAMTYEAALLQSGTVAAAVKGIVSGLFWPIVLLIAL